MVALSTIVIGICLGVFVGWSFADYFMLWRVREPVNNSYNADIYRSLACLLPILLGHFVTIWGNYFRTQTIFERSIRRITQPTESKQRASIWERHDPYLGYTVKFWVLTAVVVCMNLYWFVLTAILSRSSYVETYGTKIGALRVIIFGSGQCILLDSSIILFLVLRRSMLHAIGFTYPDIIPLHRWVGFAIIWWGTVHTWFYCAYLIMVGRIQIDIAFTDTGRGTRNMPGVFAWIALVLLGILALPKVRRSLYPLFIYSHRIGAFVFFATLLLHYPSFMLWYYLLPSFVLFIIDRFVPKMIQARSIHPEAICSLNSDADIIRMKLTSHEPIKPYYPGDYITVQIPGLGNINHPFSIASYWPEDPYSVTLFMRVSGNNKKSWTRQLADLCKAEENRIAVRVHSDGIFGDRRHDYLESETMVIFIAGAAITTFIALIKAIAAQTASSSEPLRMKVYLICTFRTRSELHAYGSFLHQITRDPRFTSWLHVEIYVSRPDKRQTLMGSHAHVVKNDIQVPGNTKKSKGRRFASLRRTGTRLRHALSGNTLVDRSSSRKAKQASSEAPVVVVVTRPAPTLQVNINSESLDTMSGISIHRNNSDVTATTSKVIQEEINGSEITTGSISVPESLPRSRSIGSIAPGSSLRYQDYPLPTFEAASASSVSKRLAKMDLVASAIIALVPLAIFYGLRTIRWEGEPRWCPLTNNRDGWTIFICYWAYSFIPPVVQTIVMLVLGYLGVWVAQRAHSRKDQAKNATDPETGYPKLEDEKRQSVEDGNWDEGDVVYSQGRMDIHRVLKSLTEVGVGAKDKGQVTVLVGGPEGFLNMIERQVKKTEWDVNLHRETWAP